MAGRNTVMDVQLVQLRFGLIGRSGAMVQAVERIIQVAPTNLSVLITGESGTGKDVVARAIHGLSTRSSKRLVSVNCGALPETLLESELFGYEKGAFTGAVEQRKGFFETAHDGTIFLDEIGEMTPQTQVKLLRVLENGEFSRVGSSDIQHVNVRVLAATNRNLEQAVHNREFREDLYFRLNAVQIGLPALRERKEDIQLLVNYFGAATAKDLKISFEGVSDDALEVLTNLPWPGNVRELRNMIVTIVTLERGKLISTEMLRPHLPRILKQADMPSVPQVAESHLIPTSKASDQAERELIYKTVLTVLEEVRSLRSDLESGIFGKATAEEQDELKVQQLNLEHNERQLIELALDRCQHSRRKAAQLLGISERTLYRKIQRYNLDEIS